MHRQSIGRLVRVLGVAIGLGFGAAGHGYAQTAAPAPASPSSPASSVTPKDAAPAPAAPKSAAPTPATPEPKPPAPSATPAPPPIPAPTPGKELAPPGTPHTDEVEPNSSPTTPGIATTETVDVPARPVVMVKGQSSYDDAFKSITASIAAVTAAMDKAGLKATGHPITIFTDTDDKGFKYETAVPIAAAPAGQTDLGGGVTLGVSPSGKALKFQHRGPYDEIDATYATITSYLDNKGLQTDSPYIEEYVSALKSPDDPYLAVDIYIFLK